MHTPDPVADLSGRWRAHRVDDELRRAAIEVSFDDGDWPELDVPGHWRSTAAFADSDGPLLYRRRFDAARPADGRRRWVVLDGLFYQADVWLDGVYLGDPEGYFFAHRYDITAPTGIGGSAAITGRTGVGEHVLAVEVTCAPEHGTTGRRNITGAFQHSEAVPTSWNPGGLWAPVRLVDTGPVAIERFRVLCRDADALRAHLHLAARLDTVDARRVVVRTRVDGVLLAAAERDLAAGSNELAWSLDVPEPRLWWPRALGEPALSEVTVEVVTDGEVSDSTIRRTGFRQVSLSDWKCSINGERLFLKGVNLTPTRPGLADIEPGLAAADIRRVVEAGLDCVRLQGHVGAPETYAAADEAGIVILQDFPLTFAYGRHIRRAATTQARAMVDTLGHHPSIVQWCAHDEPVADSVQLVDGAPASRLRRFARQQLPSWNKTVLDRWVKRAIEAADPTRPTIAHSGVLPHFPQLAGTSTHSWIGWHDGELGELRTLARRVPRLVRFLGEFGAQSAPLRLADAAAGVSLEDPGAAPDARRSAPANSAAAGDGPGRATADAPPVIDPFAWPDLDWERLRDEHGLDVTTMLRRFPPTEFASFVAWARATQEYQAELLRHHIELLRTLKYRPAGGFTFSLLADAAPAISASVFDHQRRPKAAWTAVLEACRPVIVTTPPLDDGLLAGTTIELPLHVVNDLRHPLDATVTVTAAFGEGPAPRRLAFAGSVDADDVAHVGTASIALPVAATELRATIELAGTTTCSTSELPSDVAPPTPATNNRQVTYTRQLTIRVASG